MPSLKYGSPLPLDLPSLQSSPVWDISSHSHLVTQVHCHYLIGRSKIFIWFRSYSKWFLFVLFCFSLLAHCVDRVAWQKLTRLCMFCYTFSISCSKFTHIKDSDNSEGDNAVSSFYYQECHLGGVHALCAPVIPNYNQIEKQAIRMSRWHGLKFTTSQYMMKVYAPFPHKLFFQLKIVPSCCDPDVLAACAGSHFTGDRALRQ